MGCYSIARPREMTVGMLGAPGDRQGARGVFVHEEGGYQAASRNDRDCDGCGAMLTWATCAGPVRALWRTVPRAVAG